MVHNMKIFSFVSKTLILLGLILIVFSLFFEKTSLFNYIFFGLCVLLFAVFMLFVRTKGLSIDKTFFSIHPNRIIRIIYNVYIIINMLTVILAFVILTFVEKGTPIYVNSGYFIISHGDIIKGPISYDYYRFLCAMRNLLFVCAPSLFCIVINNYLDSHLIE